MKNNWKKDELGNLIEYCARGVSPSYTEGAGVIVLNQKCIRDNKISLEPSRITDSEKKKISEEKYLKKFDILVNSTGVGTLGRVAQFKGSNEMMTADSHVTIVRPDDKKIDPFFLGYVMSFKQVEIEKMGVGATGQTELSRNTLKELEIGYPEKIEDQKKIADVLSVYDNLIENNNRRIKILEEMAQLIYKEWFVDFKFPGHEKVKMVEGELGLMPEGWEVKKLIGLVDDLSRGPSLKYIENEGIPVLNQRCVRGGEIELCAVQYAEKLSSSRDNCYLRMNDILINSMGVGTLGRISRNVSIDYMMIIHNCITFVRADKSKINQFVLYYALKSQEKKYELLGIGATGQTSLKKEVIGDTKILVPNHLVQEKFEKLIYPMWKEVGMLKNKNNNLRQTRDLLLPKLMSEEINL